MRAKRRWRSATNNFRRGQSPNDPGPWDLHVSAIPFTEQQDIRITLTRAQQSKLQTLAKKIDDQGTALKPLAQRLPYPQDKLMLEKRITETQELANSIRELMEDLF